MIDPTPEQIGKLAAAVCAVKADVGAVKKTGKNQHGNYNYASNADLAYALQPVMAKHGLALFPYKQDARPSEATGGSKMRYRMLLVTTWRLIHTGGGWMEFQTVGEGADSLDKAAYKAQTGALKYAQRQIFQIPTGDDPENDSRNIAPESDEKKRARLAKAPHRFADKADQDAFMSTLAGFGVKYADLKEFHLERLEPKPSTLDHAGRKQAVLDMEPGAPRRKVFDAWLARKKPQEVVERTPEMPPEVTALHDEIAAIVNVIGKPRAIALAKEVDVDFKATPLRTIADRHQLGHLLRVMKGAA